jgi:hypothetical protein
MISVASMIGVLTDQIGPAPVVVQCAPALDKGSIWAQLLIASLPSVLALIVAWFAFWLNSRGERNRWVLDQKKAEWKELLAFAAEVERFTPSVAVGSELIGTVHDPLFRDHLREMTRAVLKSLFIASDKAEKIYSRLVTVQFTNEKSKGHIEDYDFDPHLAGAVGKPRPLEAAQNVQSELVSLWREIRVLASEDMNLESSNSRWKSATTWIRRKTQGASAPETASKTPTGAG